MKHYFLLSALSIALLFGAVERPPEAANAAPYLGTKVIATSFTFGQLRNSLEAAIEKSGMYVVTSASAGAGTKRRGIDIPGNPVLSVYRNDFAVLMLKASVPSGIEAPLRFYVTENADGTATLTYREPSAVFRVCGSADIDKMATELDAIWAEIVTGTISK